MRAKPRKCKSLGLSRTNVSFRNPLLNDKTFSAFDPGLTISGSKITFLANEPFRFLGRILFSDLSDSNQRACLLTQIAEYMALVDTTPLKAIAKVWLYNNYIMAFITWPFLTYEYPPSFVNKITALCNRYLKRWLHLHKSASPEILYLPCPGLGAKHPTTVLKSLQVVKHLILASSNDPRTQYVATTNYAKANADRSKRWKPELAAVRIESELRWEEKYMRSKENVTQLQASTDNIKFTDASNKGKRKLITTRLKQKETEAMRLRLIDLCRGGNYLAFPNRSFRLD